MKKFELVATTALVAQIAAGEKVSVVVDGEGNLFIPILQSAALTGSGGKVVEIAAGASAAVAETVAPKRGAGRGAAAPATAPAVKDHTATLTKIFSQLADDGEVNAASDALAALTDDDAKHGQLTELVNQFMSDESLTVEGQVAAANTILSSAAAAPKRGAARGAAAPAAPKTLNVADLKKGDRVEVFLSGEIVGADAEGWYAGEVTKTRGGVAFTFDDDNSTMSYEDAGSPEVRYEQA